MASPIAADGRIYFFSDEGPVTVIAAGRKYKELAVNKLDDGFLASPAVAGKAIVPADEDASVPDRGSREVDARLMSTESPISVSDPGCWSTATLSWFW